MANIVTIPIAMPIAICRTGKTIKININIRQMYTLSNCTVSITNFIIICRKSLVLPILIILSNMNLSRNENTCGNYIFSIFCSFKIYVFIFSQPKKIFEIVYIITWIIGAILMNIYNRAHRDRAVA